jgi:hypothetical protein
MRKPSGPLSTEKYQVISVHISVHSYFTHSLFKNIESQKWWPTSIILTLGRLRKEDYKFKARFTNLSLHSELPTSLETLSQKHKIRKQTKTKIQHPLMLPSSEEMKKSCITSRSWRTAPPLSFRATNYHRAPFHSLSSAEKIPGKALAAT